MDRFIEMFLNDEGFGPSMERKDVPPEKIEKFRGKLPNKLLEYWQQYGWCGYTKGLFWTWIQMNGKGGLRLGLATQFSWSETAST